MLTAYLSQYAERTRTEMCMTCAKQLKQAVHFFPFGGLKDLVDA